MLLLWFLILSIIGAVNCDDSSENYILEISDGEIKKAYDTPFKVYWNVPTKQCRYQKNSIPFDDILRKYSISYNKNDKFEGETITIIYDGGFIPAILKRDGAKFSVRNGGLPQEGSLELHLTTFRETVIRLIPDPNFKGVGVIDMESWRPIFRQHWSTLASIIDLSLSIEKRQYWWWPSSWLKMEATKRFEDAARIFMEKTISTAKQMRPKAIWGYYGYPYCYNMGKDMNEHCSTTVKAENDRTYWLWAESTALYPSLYSSSQFSTSELEALVRGRLTEANRVKQAGTLVLPYFWIKYREGDFIKEEDLIAVFEVLQKKHASGLVIWGASNDVNQIEKCKQLYKYVNSILGPIVKKYIQRINKVYVNGTFNNTIYIETATTQRTILDINKENTHINNLITTEKLKNTSFIYEQEQLHKYYYETDENKTHINSSNESDIWGIIPYGQIFEEENKSESINLSLATIKTISNKNSSLYNDTSKENSSYSSNLFNNTSDLIKFTDHTNTSTFLIINNTESNIFNDLIYNAGNLKNSVKALVNINVTEINTETDPEIVHIIEEERQLGKYYYETDSNKTDIKSFNESNIWNIVNYKENLEHENNTETVVKIKYTEPSYMNPSMVNKITFNENNINPSIVTRKNSVQSISNDLAISLGNLTEILNSSDNKNSSDIVKITEPVATRLAYESYSKDVNIFDAKRHNINGSFNNIDETDGEENNIFDNSVTSSVNLASPIVTQLNSYKIGTTENVITSTNNYSIYSSQEDFNDLMNSAENFTNSLKTLVNINVTEIDTETDPEIIHIIEEKQQLGKYYYETDNNKTDVKFNESNIWNRVNYTENLEHENNTETVVKIKYTEPSYMNPSMVNNITLNKNNIDPSIVTTKNAVQNISNHLAISLVNSTKILNSSENKNSSDIVQIIEPIATRLTYENYSKDINIFDVKRHNINGSFHNIDETVGGKNNIFDDSVTSLVNPASPIVTQLNSYRIGITENEITSTNNYSIYSSQEDFYDLMNSAENFTNSVKTLVNINVTEIDTETDPEIIHIIEEKQQLGKYYYETDKNKTDVKGFNESNIWNRVNYTENFEHENNTETVVKIKYTEPSYMNPSMVNNITLNKNNIDPSIVTTKNAVQNISNHLAISLVNSTKILNSSENKNSSDIVQIIEPIATRLTYENYSKDVNIFDAKRHNINGSFHNIDETVGEENNIFDDSVNLASPIDIQLNSYEIGITENVITPDDNFSIYSSQKENGTGNIPYQNIEGPDIRENDISDDLITVEANFNSSMNTQMQSHTEIIDNNLISQNSLEFKLQTQRTNYSKSISQNFKLEEQLIENGTNQNIDTPDIKENDISDYLITVAVNSSRPTNISVNSNDTRIALKNLESINKISLYLLPSNYFERNWKEISDNVIQEEVVTQNSTYPSIGVTITTENDISDDSLTSAGKMSSIKTSLNSNDTGIKEKNKLENNLDFKLVSANNYSEAFSQYIKLDEQTLKDTTNVNNKASFGSGNEIPDYLIILAEDTNQMNKIVNRNSTGTVKNVSQNYQQEDQLNQNFTNSPVKPTASSENHISDYLIILTRNTSSPINTSVKVSDIDEELEYKEVDENYSTSNENDL